MENNQDGPSTKYTSSAHCMKETKRQGKKENSVPASAAATQYHYNEHKHTCTSKL
jgi:hypothetical protein